ncbi:hypothetical protein PV326_008093 [Microctonus aethiopoides]|nr:hypothetical protein PV326_008093 [Microctonus aethiopoides]
MVLKGVKGGFEENDIIEEINRELPFYHPNHVRKYYKRVKINKNYRPPKKTHPKGECKISTQDQKSNLKCANCGGQGHPANYKGCPFYKYANNILTQGRKEEVKKTQQVIKKAISINKFIEPGVSFAEKTKNVKGAYTNHPTIKQLSDNTESMTHNTNTSNNITSGLKEFKNEIISMMKAFQNANNLLNEKLDNNYKQLQDMINKNMENINTKLETITANLNEKINSNANNIEKMLNSFMEINCE